ncbi:MAG TPA: PspC domain-containing protein [Solirubrobacteraceae bacterium]|jgi:phage shock protein PspC (stress-responsive transcriptional regulator)|nr:PspC domain-containing protein [Solirubrobacteraceae bacterium]
MTILPPSSDVPLPLSRAEHGRWLGGVCAGVARVRDLPVGRLRLAFVLGGLVGGIGVLAYLACWLIIPAEGDEAEARSPRGIVVLAQACAAGVGLATLGAVGATATVFGFGWVVVALAAAVLVSALASWPRIGPGWALLPVAALALPSVGVAAGGVRLTPQSGHATVAPRTIAGSPAATYRSGLNTMLVDLRHTAIPATGGTLRIDAGVRRTIVALPHDRCVNVNINYHVVQFAARVASIVSGRADSPFSEIVVFGANRYGRDGVTGNTNAGANPGAPTLTIDFDSAGGSLYVRDYPDAVDPDSGPDWPGYPVYPEQRPDTRGTPKAAARRLVRDWRARHSAQLRSQRMIDTLMPGPCAAKAARS